MLPLDFSLGVLDHFGSSALKHDHPVLWFLAAVATLVTTRHLFATGYHYAYPILLAHLVPAVALRFFYRAKISSDDIARPAWVVYTSSAAFIAFTVVTLLHTVKAMLLMHNTTVVVLVLALRLDAALCPKELAWSQAFAARFALQLFTVVPCVLVLLLDENLISDGKNGEQACLIAAGSFLMAKVLWNSSLASVRDHTVGGLDLYTWGLVASIPVVSLVVLSERELMGDFTLGGYWALLIVNTFVGAIALSSGTYFQLLNADPIQMCRHESDSKMEIGWTLSCGLATLIVIDNWVLQVRPTVTSLAQWFAFAVTAAALLDTSQFASALEWLHLEKVVPGRNFDDVQIKTHALRADVSSDVAWTLRLRCLLCGLTWLVFLVTALYHIPQVPTSHVPDLTSDWDLDVVVARYSASLTGIIGVAESFLEQANAQDLRSRIIVYDKGEPSIEESEVSTLISPWKESIVIRNRTNLGREGETYLYHILEEWTGLAHHTLFMQEEPHELNAAIIRFRDHFIPNTGFMSLSYSTNFCPSCDRSFDLSGWYEDPVVLRHIFARSNPGTKCRDISLTYRGQFLVSRARATSVDRTIFEGLRDQLLSNPDFGFTLERMWGVVLQCPRIRADCPSLESGKLGKKASIDSCQCLDEMES